MASANVPESAAVSVELDGGGIEQKMEPMFGSSLKGRMQQRLPARLRGKPEGAGLFDPFTNGTEGPGAPPYSWLEIVKTVLMTPIAVVRILLFFLIILLLGVFVFAAGVQLLRGVSACERGAAATQTADAIYMGTKVFPSVVSKASNVDVPVVGFAVRSLDAILVPSTREERARIPPVMHQMRDRLGLPVEPLDGAVGAAASAWTPDVGMPFLLFRLCCQVYNEITTAIAAELGVPACPLSNADSFLYQGAIRGGFAQYALRHMLAQPSADRGSAGGGFFTRVARRHTNAQIRSLVKLARGFAAADADQDGALTRDEFVAHFASRLLEAELAFAVIDRQGDGHLDRADVDVTEITSEVDRLFDVASSLPGALVPASGESADCSALCLEGFKALVAFDRGAAELLLPAVSVVRQTVGFDAE
ncbi:hypothetical protein FNF29_04503 [Cafeteria roenbergensis]|uniref:EF-hand domain-containing protein n=1 Tax=Cafeteria roenbergensis TaxID=33653 RepID=A0A5A8CFY3_CAFRO|nr:hypothetical protein FNF29_04503 [Cafeteria roenbergensis]|eukprot:KAA0151579.1 hypothetical protein FNF29_04503 [Cafeteria roenbergensis]